MPRITEVICTWDNQQFRLRSLNISESGMLLQPSAEIEIGHEVALEFKIAEVSATLKVLARVVRQEGTERMGVEFIGFAPEEFNAIQLYVLGRLERDMTPPRDLSNIGIHWLYKP